MLVADAPGHLNSFTFCPLLIPSYTPTRTALTTHPLRYSDMTFTWDKLTWSCSTTQMVTHTVSYTHPCSGLLCSCIHDGPNAGEDSVSVITPTLFLQILTPGCYKLSPPARHLSGGQGNRHSWKLGSFWDNELPTIWGDFWLVPVAREMGRWGPSTPLLTGSCACPETH